MLESVITGIVSISLDNYVTCLEAMLFPTLLAGFCKTYESYDFVWDELNVSDF